MNKKKLTQPSIKGMLLYKKAFIEDIKSSLKPTSYSSLIWRNVTQMEK